MKNNKRGLSEVITVVLLIVLALAITSTIFLYSRGMLGNAQKEGAKTLADAECAKRYNFQVAGCFNKSTDNLYLDIVNLNENLSAGTQIAFKSETTKVLTFMDPAALDDLATGNAKSITINPIEINFTSFGLKRVQILPIFETNGIRVLCDNLNEIDVKEC